MLLLLLLLRLLQEHQVYPYAVSALVDERITWREDGIPIIWSAH
jgi:phosphoribosylglycinamide formyltransferase